MDPQSDSVLGRLSLRLKTGLTDRFLGSSQTYSLKTYSESTSSQQTFAHVDSWFRDCKVNHEKCREVATDPKWYPTRLIDIGPLDTSSFVCRITNTGDETPHGPYMTLSHCWGSANSLILTKSNAAELFEGIPLESLPRLYRDAACFVRKLGVRYLWIDALCIIQTGDGLADWRHESTLMDKVYSHAFCNLSALSGLDSSNFLFTGGTSILADHHLTTTPSEIWPPDIPVKDPYEGPRIEDLQLGDNGARGKTKSTRKAYDCWSKIVVTYTDCKITFPSHRMIALFAIAKEMIKVLGDEHIAGMWRRHLESKLLWRVPAVSTPSGSPPIAYSPIGLPLIKVEDYQIEYVTDEKTGLISGGWLRLWGVLKQMKLYRREGPHRRDDDHHKPVWNVVVNGLNPREEQRENHVKLDMFHDNFDKQNDNSIPHCMPAKCQETSLLTMLKFFSDNLSTY
ncbi:heterokaryon incompatibility protein-domain-containing protein [Colletotrichum lupini]|nr:heterokaryon incompatibility protein-domain-containing protein [Colletotrichum lupini]